MTVQAILAQKGSAIVTAKSDDRIATICDLLADRRIGAVLIVDADGRIDGILSERDIVRAVARDRAACLDRPVSAYMTRTVTTCAPQDTVPEVMAWMTAGRFRHMPVVDEGRVVGVVSIGDVVKQRIAQAEKEAEEMRTYIHMA